MFRKKQSVQIPEVDVQPNTTVVPKYLQPKILLIDMADNVETMLKAEGYNISTGIFGTPYKVKKNDLLIPVVTDGHLPDDFAEKDIVIIDLELTEPVDGPTRDKHTSLGESDWWTSCKWGIVDPRPRLMLSAQDSFNRILKHGGIFIIFAAQRINQEYLLGREEFNRFVKESNIPFDNWCFLSILEDLEIKDYQGKEITLISSDHPLINVLSKYIRSSRINCTIESYRSYLNDSWIPIADQKYGVPVSGLILEDKDRKGLILILPQLENKAQFLTDLVKQVLPDMAPKLFPHVEGARWLQRSEYELPKVRELRTQIEQLQEQVRQQVVVLEEVIEKERLENNYLDDLLGGTGPSLVSSVKRGLEVLGFEHVVDADEEMLRVGKSGPKREDLQIADNSPLLLVEVKGISGLPKESAALQVWKYVAPRMRELNRVDVHGLSIINHQRHVPGLERENRVPFSEDVLANAEDQKFGLLTTWDLYRLIRNYLRHNWEHNDINGIFYSNGRIEPVPTHYHHIGVVEEFWERVGAVGVRLQTMDLRQGDKIAFEFPIEFEEQEILSLQVDRTQVEVAIIGSLAGVRTPFSKEQLRKGVRVYRVQRMSDSSNSD